MATYRVQLRLAVNESSYAFKWSNVFFVNAQGAGDAADKGLAVWNNTWRNAHANVTFCYEVYASDLLPLAVDYTIKAHPLTANIFGSIAPAGEIMPTFNVARADLNVLNSRPSRKYIRLPMSEGQVFFDNLVGTALTGVQSGVNGLLGQVDLTDESGRPFTGATLKGITSRRLGKFAFTAVPGKPVIV